MNRYIYSFCVLLLCQLPATVQAEFAYLQDRRVFEGDFTTLVIQYDRGIPSLYAIDTSELEVDFEVLNSKSQLSRIINENEAFHRMQWEIQILPKRIGKLRIPPIKVGDVSTQELELEVLAHSVESRRRENVFIELETRPEHPLVGQQIDVITRLYHNLPLFDDELQEPGSRDVDIYQNNRQKIYTVQRNGERFDVIERKIVIVTRSAGIVELQPARYQGSIQSASGSTTDSTPRLRQIYRQSEALKLEIRTPPSQYGGSFWLPARRLKLDLSWDEIADDLEIGDSIGLTLTIESRGMPAAALPAKLIDIDAQQFKVYADQEIRKDRLDGNDLVGRLEQRFAVVMTQPGEIDFPATELGWWNTDKGREELVRAEGRKFIVADPLTRLSSGGELSGLPGLENNPQNSAKLWSTGTKWIWIVVAVLVAVFLWRAYRRLIQPHISAMIAVYVARYSARHRLRQACHANDPVATRQALIAWARLEWPDANINGLGQLSACFESSRLEDALAKLDAALYAGRDSQWQGSRLRQLLASRRHRGAAQRAGSSSILPSLYPQSS